MPARKKTTTTKAKRAAATKSEEMTLTDDTQDSTTSRKNPLRKLLSYLPIILGLLAVVFIFWLISKYLVVAWVNKKPITRFEYYNALEKKDMGQTKDQLIREKLVADEASKKGVKITDQDIQDRFKLIEEQLGGAEALDQRLQMNGLTRAEASNSIRNQLVIERVFGEGVNITDEEVNKYAEENKAQLPETVDDKVKAQIKDELRLQKINENYNKWLEDAMNSKNVTKV